MRLYDSGAERLASIITHLQYTRDRCRSKKFLGSLLPCIGRKLTQAGEAFEMLRNEEIAVS